MNYRIYLLLRRWKKSLCSETMEKIFTPIKLNLHSEMFPLRWQQHLQTDDRTRCPKIRINANKMIFYLCNTTKVVV